MLRESDLRLLDEMLARAPLALVAWTHDFRISYWSSRAAELFDYSAGDALGKDATELQMVHPDDLTDFTDVAIRVRSGNLNSYVNVNRNIRNDGTIRTLRWTTVAVQDDPEFEVISFAEDITESIAQQAALFDSEERFRSLFVNNPDGIFAVSLDRLIVDVNDAALRLADRPREDVLGANYKLFLPPNEHDRADRAVLRALGGEMVSLTVESFKMNGSPLEIETTLVPQYAGGKVVGLYVICQDTTERHVAERRAEMQRQRIRNLYFIAASGDFPDVRMRASLEMGCRSFDLSVGAVIDATEEALRIDAVYRHPRFGQVEDGDILEMARQVIDRGAPGVPITFAKGIAVRFDIGGERYGAIVFASDALPTRAFSDTDADLLGLISTLMAGAIDRSRQRARLRSMAYYDSLTSLPNRALIAEKLRDAIEVAQSRLTRVAVLFLDLDRFKDVNDTLGHARGDHLLQLVAQRLIAEFGEYITLARMGGDEFVIMLTDCPDTEAIRDIAERVIAVINEPFRLDEYEQFISTSIGVSVYPEDGRDEQTLIKNADIAMYRAKDRGRNGYYFYNPTLESPIHMRLSQEKLLRRALELNEFLVYYQPQLDILTGRITCIEALVRWNHPKSGLIEPSHFIPSAEISGLIVPLGHWVLETAAKQVMAWQATLGPLRIAVNLSGRQFHQRDLRRRILSVLDETGLDPQMLELEITETVAMTDAAQTVAIVRDLKSSGIRISVDDFGTGYSSLSYLRRFALDVLKIDRSFVSGIGRESSDETIVKTVIGMAHSLGLVVVAEGVESPAQMSFLTGQRCDLAQGFLIAQPLPPDVFERFMLARREGSPTSG